MSRRTLAKRAHISQRYLELLEAGQVDLELKIVFSVMKALGRSYDELVGSFCLYPK